MIYNCTLSGNSATYQAGGIYNEDGALEIHDSTLNGNLAIQGGGIYNDGGVVTIGGTILKAGASGKTIEGDSSISSAGYNLSNDDGGGFLTGGAVDHINTDPKLGPLQDNGGPTFTHALLAGSPAIDQGYSFGLTTDQRGQARPFDFSAIANTGDGSDIGAFEYIPVSPQLNVQLAGNNAVLSWSTNDFGFALQSITALPSPPNIWSTVPDVPVVVGGQFVVTNGLTTGTKFYRLKAP